MSVKLNLSEYSKEQRSEIGDAITKGLDIQNILNPHLTPLQMKKIKEGVESGIDPSVYASPSIHHERMEELKQALLACKKPEDYTIKKLSNKDQDRLNQLQLQINMKNEDLLLYRNLAYECQKIVKGLLAEREAILNKKISLKKKA